MIDTIKSATNLDPNHVVSLVYAEHYTTNHLTKAQIRTYCRRADKMGAQALADFHAAETDF